MLFTIIRHDKPDHLHLRLSERPKHLEYLVGVVDKIIYGGAFLDDVGNQVGSILIIDVADMMAADAFAAADPYVDANLFASTTIRRFRPVFENGMRL